MNLQKEINELKQASEDIGYNHALLDVLAYINTEEDINIADVAVWIGTKGKGT